MENRDSKKIILKGVKTHGLKNIDLEIPHDQMTCITGLSGSGKSSLAIDTLFAEGQRRYLESLSTYARQFLNKFEKPEFDKIEGLRPSIAIEQKTQGHNPRSTVGTVTEIYDYLRVLFARLGTPYSPFTNLPLQAFSPSEITSLLLKKTGEWQILSPIARNRKGEFKAEIKAAQKGGFRYLIINSQKHNLDTIPELDKQKPHNIEILIDTVEIGETERYQIESACASALEYGKGIAILKSGNEIIYCSQAAACPISGFALEEQTPRLFSFNSPVGACANCSGLGSYWLEDEYSIQNVCNVCKGKRLNNKALCVKINNLNIWDFTQMPLDEAKNWIDSIKLNDTEQEIALPLITEISKRLGFLCDVGLQYLTLGRSADTISGGESQRIRLASQIGSGLEGVLYVLDEPSIGLHPQDQKRLINTLLKLRNLGNTLVIVEHDEETMKASDNLIELGPGAGRNGGEVVVSGNFKEFVANKKSITAPYLKGEKKIFLPKKEIKTESFLKIKKACANNLKSIDVNIPLGNLIGICGVSGSGKSSFVMKVLAESIKMHKRGEDYSSLCQIEGEIPGLEIVDQSPIGRTPRSNPATYTGIMTDLRDWYASLAESKVRGFTASRFSFNVEQGRCRLCNGEGVRRVEMHFLPDIQITCESCQGKRYNQETCEIKFNGLSIADVLNLKVDEALEIFEFLPATKRMLQTLCDVHLGYITLGQNAVTLSGGEAQRLKLAKILGVKKQNPSMLYILDEPTTGLHFDDIQALLLVLRKLVDKGNTVIVIEHHVDLLKSMDWLFEIGPVGGKNGGYLIAEGPSEVLAKAKTQTGIFL